MYILSRKETPTPDLKTKLFLAIIFCRPRDLSESKNIDFFFKIDLKRGNPVYNIDKVSNWSLNFAKLLTLAGLHKIKKNFF